MEADFSGWATKAGLKCSDGRIITSEAFKHLDGLQVPMVWQHGHGSPTNVLGHVLLEHRKDGIYCYGFFNDTEHGIAAHKLVMHKDIKMLSIYANDLVEKTKQVLHGMIREVSLTLAGANPGALIEQVRIAHSNDPDDVEILDDAAVIHTGIEFDFVDFGVEVDDEDETIAHAADQSSMTVQEVYDNFTDIELTVVHYMVGAAVESAMAEAAHSDVDNGGAEDTTPTEGDLTHQEGTTAVTNVFEQQGKTGENEGERHILSHDAMNGIFETAKRLGSVKQAVESYALAHGIDNIDTLFPDAKLITNTPEWFTRRTEWVNAILTNVHHTPFAKVRTLWADLTLDEARAKGYVKGDLKKEQFFAVYKRETGPTTVYKKQALHRDDVVDITDFDIVSWMKGEMRLMLEEEVARAILLGDGREVDDEDKINETMIRPIATDDDLYSVTVYSNLDDASSSYLEFMDAMIENRRLYRGSGQPSLFISEVVLAKLLTLRDGDGRKYYRGMDEIASELRVRDIIPVEAMDTDTDLLAIMVNMSDYNVGTNMGGEINLFDQFDIDYNKQKYLIETRMSGALTKIRSALVFRKTASAAVLTVPNAPTFVSSTGVVTIVATTGIVYKNKATGATLATGAQTAIAAGAQIVVEATPSSSSYYIANTVEDQWTFTRDRA